MQWDHVIGRKITHGYRAHLLTAALSSLNAGLYSTGRILRSLSMGGSAPKSLSAMNAQGVPYKGILITVVINAFGVLLNYLIPAQIFELLLNMAALGIITTWAFIVLSQIYYRRAVRRGEVQMVSFRMPGAPFTSWMTLGFLAFVLILMAFDYPSGTYTLSTIPLIVVALMIGWSRTSHAKKAKGFSAEKAPAQ